jgi:hypothetical protein
MQPYIYQLEDLSEHRELNLRIDIYGCWLSEAGPIHNDQPIVTINTVLSLSYLIKIEFNDMSMAKNQ